MTEDRNLMWRGPTWAMPNWLIMEGLTKHKYNTEASMSYILTKLRNGSHSAIDELLDRWVAAVEKGGIYEQWNPLTAESYGSEGLKSSLGLSSSEIGLGMSTLIVDWLYRLDKH